MTGEGTFRILAAHSTEFVREAASVAGAGPEATELYGRFLTGCALMQLAQAPFDRVQCSIRQTGSLGELLADVWPGPTVRGRLEFPSATQAPMVTAGGMFHCTRRPARGGELYESVVPISSGGVGDALQQLLLESDQVLTFFSLVVVLDPAGQVARAGGLLVQAMPDATREHLEAITSCLEKANFADLVTAGDPPLAAAEALFHSLSLHHVGGDPLLYRCRCSKQAAVAAVSLLSDTELDEIRAGQEQRVTCEFCGQTQTVTALDLGAA